VSDSNEIVDRRKKRAILIYLVCSVWSVVCFAYTDFPGSSLLWMTPLAFAATILQSAFGGKSFLIGLAVFIPVGLAAFAFCSWNRALRPPTPHLPQYLAQYEIVDRGIINIPDPGGNVDSDPSMICWIRVPEKSLKVLLEQHQSLDNGFSTEDKEAATHVDFKTGESWNLYTGQKEIPKFPTLAGSSTRTGSDDTWSTLVYRPPFRNL
jgi:hypothetical protein